MDIKKFYKDLKPQPNTSRVSNPISKPQAANDSNGKEKRSIANKSVEHDKSDSSKNANQLIDFNEKQNTITKTKDIRKLDNLSPVKNFKITNKTTRFSLKNRNVNLLNLLFFSQKTLY